MRILRIHTLFDVLVGKQIDVRANLIIEFLLDARLAAGVTDQAVHLGEDRHLVTGGGEPRRDRLSLLAKRECNKRVAPPLVT